MHHNLTHLTRQKLQMNWRKGQIKIYCQKKQMYERVKKISRIEFNLLKICINSDILGDSLSSYHRKVVILLFSHAVLLK